MMMLFWFGSGYVGHITISGEGVKSNTVHFSDQQLCGKALFTNSMRRTGRRNTYTVRDRRLSCTVIIHPSQTVAYNARPSGVDS